jgi:ubiquinone/menaquinone biosynthesis C-methylase UbiE
LPFGDRTFDFVHSSAVFEHVGNREKQVQFLRELWRVARKGMFVTTPNRWFPIEFHTVLPLVHWLPTPVYRKIFSALGRDFFADVENLNLISRRGLARAAVRAGIDRFQITTVSLFGWPTNLLLIANKSRR